MGFNSGFKGLRRSGERSTHEEMECTYIWRRSECLEETEYLGNKEVDGIALESAAQDRVHAKTELNLRAS